MIGKEEIQIFRLIDLFAGAGGMTLGFTDDRFCGDFSCTFSLDFDNSAMLTHSANFGGEHIVADIEEFLQSSAACRRAGRPTVAG